MRSHLAGSRVPGSTPTSTRQGRQRAACGRLRPGDDASGTSIGPRRMHTPLRDNTLAGRHSIDSRLAGIIDDAGSSQIAGMSMFVYPLIFLIVTGLVYGALWKRIGQDPAIIFGAVVAVWACIQVRHSRHRGWARKSKRRKASWPSEARECSKCHGLGKTTELSSTTRGTSFINLVDEKCLDCGGRGYLTY